MFNHPLFSSWLVVGFWVLMSLSSTVTSATIEPTAMKRSIECNRRWSTEDYYKNPDYVSCDDENENVCNARYCHMGGPVGDPDINPVNKGLFLVKCAKIDHKGNVLTPHKYRIFPRTYAVSTQGYILTHGFAPFEKVYQMTMFNCTWNQAANLNTHRVWCNSCFPKPPRD
ncbi:hypothetical protein PCANC_08086 [Puccinia coronata f. sp. avenae]|uniref:Uncharacterized protein n=1 Tax=Puccinia coronata f. sp. avenae TaxID=200324 RepID=A0A2N5V3P5_9BASI|nr:hypothetical protein PCANC_25410 [Puccinia coronata f. sp. avenae]PLW19965.1 hypothetical protein PCASD_17709 [Puccinia coronata f. sp. avenae]PLW44567.1 hypothetical protein PCANC_08086 [Puccinia coronata f. sp. avenae]